MKKTTLLATILAGSVLALPAHAISVPFTLETNGGTGTGTITEPFASPIYDFSFTLTSNNNGSPGIITSYGATATDLIEVTYTWAYFTIDIDGSGPDPFGYAIDFATPADIVQLTADLPAPAIQSGSGSFIVQPGQEFGFGILSTDGRLGPATATVFGNITVVPLPAGGLLLLSGLGALAAARRRAAW